MIEVINFEDVLLRIFINGFYMLIIFIGILVMNEVEELFFVG